MELLFALMNGVFSSNLKIDKARPTNISVQLINTMTRPISSLSKAQELQQLLIGLIQRWSYVKECPGPNEDQALNLYYCICLDFG